MRWKLSAALTIVVWAAGLRAGGAKPSSNVSAFLWFGNVATDALKSDGQSLVVNGTLADYVDGFQNVLAAVQTTGNFRFTTSSNTRLAPQRGMCVDFGTQFGDRAMAIPFTNGLARQCVDTLEAMHSYPSGDVAIQNLRYGQSVQKLVRFTWTDGGYYYRIGYGSDMNMDGVMDSPPVIVTCIAPQDATRTCTRWLLAPFNSGGTSALFRFRILANGEGPAEPLGTFTLPFTQTFNSR